MTKLKRIIRVIIESPIRILAFITFSTFKHVPIHSLVERSIQILSFISRHIPENRTKHIFITNSLLLKERHFNFIFKSNSVGLFWTSSAFPDLLTRHMMFEGMYQQDVLVALRELIKNGDIVFDVGGHHGLMAIISAISTGKNGKVITFEPNPYARQYLEKHVELNNVQNVIIEDIALSDKDGMAEFYIQKGEVTWNSTIIREFANCVNYHELMMVRTVTLDDYVAQSKFVPNVIKIDVEGSEFLILNGAKKTLCEYRPVLIMEFNPLSANAAGYTISDYVELLRKESYKLFVLKSDILGYYKFSAQESFDEAKHINGSLANVICVPSSVWAGS
jgi:FkbM family methyltransferase